MAADYIPGSDGEKIDWLQNFKTKIATHGTTVGLTSAQVTALVASIDSYLTQFSALTAARNALQSNTANTRTAERNLFTDIRGKVGAMKTNAGYTEAIGEDLDVIGEELAFDPLTFKPKFKTTVLPGSVRIDFVKGRTDGVNIYCRLKGQATWKFVSRDTNSPYEDFTPLAQAGVAEMREYSLRGVVKDAEIGQMSDIASVTFAG